MAYQELGELSYKDISMDADGYTHFTRVFKVWDVNILSFYSSIDSITQVGTNLPLPDYGHEIDIRLANGAYGPFLGGSDDSVKGVCRLHEWRIRPSTAVVFVAIAHYSNDPRMPPGGVNFQSSQQQTMVPIPYARIQPVAVSGSGSTSFMECSVYLPMGVESISHTVSVPRSQLKTVERNISERVTQLHALPLKENGELCLYLGADVKMRGVQWLDVTHQWQWQQGVFSLNSAEFRQYKSNGQYVPPSASKYPPKVLPNASTLGTTEMILPPYHSVEMYFVDDSGLAPRWVYRLPYAHDIEATSGWQSLPGAEYFIWGIGP